MRLFFAIPFAGPAADALAAMQARLQETRAEVAWVEPGHYHLTIKFLGETDERLVPELAARLTRVAAQVPQFPLEVEGLGQFPEKGPPRVIVAAAYSPDQRLTKLHRLLNSAAGGIGLPLDTRELRPHITLGRVKSNHGLNKLLRLVDKHAADYLGTVKVERVILYQSTMTPEGSRYVPLAEAELKEVREQEI